MNEIATEDFSELLEIPVIDGSLFLLDKRNHDFLNGISARAFVEETHRVPGLFVLLVIAALAFIVWFLVQFSTGNGVPFSVTRQGVFWVGVFLVIGLSALFFDYQKQLGHKKQSVETSAKETPVSLPLAVKPIGVVVAGEVVEAQKGIYQGLNTTTKSLKIRYKFAAPNGNIVEARTEGLFENATSDAAPVAGTPVRVWYIDPGKYYLL